MLRSAAEQHEAPRASPLQLHRAELAAQLSYWQQTLDRSQESVERLRLHRPRGDVSWFQWEPTYACPVNELIGTYGDGVKWMCGIRDLAQPCVVYSAGSGFSAQFERSVLAQTPCEVHVFDPTGRAPDLPDLNTSRFHFHSIGISASDKLTGLANVKGSNTKNLFQVLTIGSIMRKLGHSFVDVLKMDIEGHEAQAVAGLQPQHAGAPLPFGQLLLEVHSNRVPGGSRGQARSRLFKRLHDENFHVTHKEVNVLHTSNCEYTWARVALRCARVAVGDSPRLLPVSFPWARLLPQSCDGYEAFEARARQARLPAVLADE